MKDAKEFYGFTERKLKGNIAETIVEHMLEYSGYKVFRFGYERTLEEVKNAKMSENYEKKRITTMPDFIVIGNDGYTSFLEVKYRKKGLTEWDKNKIEDLGKNWPDAFLIIVSLNGFKINRVKHLLKTGVLYDLEKFNLILKHLHIRKNYIHFIKCNNI